MPKPPTQVKRADGKILLLGEGTDYIAIESLTVTPALEVQSPPTVKPLVIAAKITVPN